MNGVCELGSREAEVLLGRVELALKEGVHMALGWVRGFGVCGAHVEDCCLGSGSRDLEV